ncbi:MAG TPA: hypothetical protein VIC07_10230 [Acidimicrobiia bacterium]|jgi:hypothetical protein
MRAGMVVRGALVASILLLLAPAAGAADQETFYLGTDGFPQATLIGNPLGGDLPNFDRGRDVEPGLLLERSALGLEEVDGARYQHWQVKTDGRAIVGFPVVVIWSAPAGFDDTMRTEFDVYLLDCNGAAADCVVLGSAEAMVDAGAGGEWTESVLALDPIDHDFADWRYLAVRVVVTESSESDVMLAYGYPKQRSRLTIYSEQPDIPVTNAADESPQPAGADFREKPRHSREVSAADFVETDDLQGDWAWVTTMVISTIVLVGFGVFLITRLTRPGRHERRSIEPPVEPGRRERVPASIR